MPTLASLSQNHTLVFFDGDCNLCNGAVNFLIDRDNAKALRFGSLQSDIARELLGDDVTGDLDSVVVVRNGVVFTRSDAVLQLARDLPLPWKLATPLRVIPRPLRDAAYRVVAKNRKRIARKPRSCRMPDPDRLSRFLD